MIILPIYITANPHDTRRDVNTKSKEDSTPSIYNLDTDTYTNISFNTNVLPADNASSSSSEYPRSNAHLPSQDNSTDKNSHSTTKQLRRAVEEVRSAKQLCHAAEYTRSVINPSNIMASTRYQKPNHTSNIGSLGGKKYHLDFLNMDNKSFNYFNQLY